MVEKGIVVGLNTNKNNGNYKDSIDELKNLCVACDIEVVGELIQNAERVNTAYYIGTGKADELRELADELLADYVIFNQELSHTQIRNIEALMKAKVLDRTALILNIFSRRAKSKEAKLQVEIARLQYELPRLINSEQKLGRQSGGVGTKNRGSGEKKLELDRRRIEEKISSLDKELQLIHKQRGTQTSLRGQSAIPKVALVGYTNAGKSTVLNYLLERSDKGDNKKVLQKDMLFATLDTSTRSIHVNGYGGFLLSDTVGFIGDLPHTLVKAFRTTLKEVNDADLLIHIIDRSNKDFRNQKAVTEQTLKEIGADQIPILNVYNKTDLLSEPEANEGVCQVSAQTGEGMDMLLKAISEQLSRNRIKYKFLLPYTMGKELPKLMSQHCAVLLEHRENGYLLSVEGEEKDLDKYKDYILK